MLSDTINPSISAVSVTPGRYGASSLREDGIPPSFRPFVTRLNPGHARPGHQAPELHDLGRAPGLDTGTASGFQGQLHRRRPHCAARRQRHPVLADTGLLRGFDGLRTPRRPIRPRTSSPAPCRPTKRHTGCTSGRPAARRPAARDESCGFVSPRQRDMFNNRCIWRLTINNVSDIDTLTNARS